LASSAKQFAADSSVALRALDTSAATHERVAAAVRRHRPVLAGHAAFEAYSVLTRLPAGRRLTAHVAAAALERNFGAPCLLSVRDTQALLGRLGNLGVVGGAVYDALVAEAARVHRRILLSLDWRAERTFRAVGVEFELL
jgi:hypothetical protein